MRDFDTVCRFIRGIFLLIIDVFTASRLTAADDNSVRFDPSTGAAIEREGRWKIADGDLWLVDLGNNEAAARDLFDHIHRFEFDHIAFVGRPNAPMTYFRKSQSNSPASAAPSEAPATFQVREGDCFGEISGRA